MVNTFAWGGAPNNTNGYVMGATLITQPGWGAPTGNLQLDASNRPIRIGNVRPDYVSGGSGVSSAIDYQGNLVGGAFEAFANSGGTFTFRIGSTGGTMYYGRNTAYDLTIYQDGVALGQRGALCGSFQWYTVPATVANFTAKRTGPDQVTVDFNYPTNDGGNAINNYRVGYRRMAPGGSWSGYMGYVTNVSGTVVFNDLLPTYSYQFTVYANNDAGNGARLTSGTIAIPAAGGRRYNGSAWIDLVTRKRYNGSAWVDLTTKKRYNGSSWVDISN